MSRLSDEVAKSRHWLELAARELPQHCQSVNAQAPDFSHQLTTQMRANFKLMKKVHAFLSWHSQHPLRHGRLGSAEGNPAHDKPAATMSPNDIGTD